MTQKSKFQIFAEGEVIGESAFENYDSRLNVSEGKFIPNENYKKYQEIFLMFGRATYDSERPDMKLLERAYQVRGFFSFRAILPNGRYEMPGQVHIYDFTNDSEITELRIAVTPPALWADQYQVDLKKLRGSRN